MGHSCGLSSFLYILKGVTGRLSWGPTFNHDMECSQSMEKTDGTPVFLINDELLTVS